MQHPFESRRDPVIPRIVYDRRYDIGLFGLERLHPFDTHKYSRAYDLLERQFGRRLRQATSVVSRPVGREELLAAHSAEYLERLKNAAYLAGALEMPPLRRLPAWVTDWRVLKPMRWATAGTIVAAQEAVRTGLAVNMSGGYHHASRDRGEGFCIYSDIALAVHELRRTDRVSADDKIIYVDLDAHQGNGVCHEFFDDRAMMIFDMFNQSIYPASDAKAKRRIDCAVPLPAGCHEADYLTALRSKLPPFLNAVTRAGRAGLAIYNAGTDIYRGDLLGGMNVSAEGILERDRFVIDELVSRGIPVLMLLSGGYSPQSYQLVAGTVSYILSAYPRPGPPAPPE